MNEEQRTQVSKSLSYFLRHNLDKLQCTVSPDGYVPLSALLARQNFRGVTVEDIQDIVRNCSKQRFTLKEDVDEKGQKIWLIRANQGHSNSAAEKFGIVAEEIYELIAIPLPYCVHGTTRKLIPLIESEGLKKMNRTHIHFASEPDAKSGFRKSSKVLVHIDMEKAMADGIKFYRSSNNVILSDGINGIIEPKYFKEIEVL
jgi:2'-phosphotransferase